MIRLKQVLRSPFSVLRSPFSVLRSPFSVLGKLTVTGLFCALLITVSFSFSACSNGSTDPGGPQTISYSGVAGGESYTLAITEGSAGRAYTPQSGDTYVLTIYGKNGKKVSSGAVAVGDGGVLTLTPAKDTTKPFTVTVEDGGITDITDYITFEDGTIAPAPASIKQSAEGDPSTLTITGIPSRYNGKYISGEIGGMDIILAAGFPSVPDVDQSGKWITFSVQSSQINGGKVTLYVYKDNAPTFTLYTGNETVQLENEDEGLFELQILSTPGYTQNSNVNDVIAAFITKETTVTQFSGGKAVLSWSDLEATDF